MAEGHAFMLLSENPTPFLLFPENCCFYSLILPKPLLLFPIASRLCSSRFPWPKATLRHCFPKPQASFCICAPQRAERGITCKANQAAGSPLYPAAANGCSSSSL
jgi:hypothetical protein